MTRAIKRAAWRERPPRDEGSQFGTRGVLALALVLRLLVLLAWARQNGAAHLFKNGLEMSLLAKSLIGGDGLSSPFGPPTGPTAIFAPVYSILVAGVFRLFGVESDASAWVMLTLHLLANLGTIWLTMRLARRFFGDRAARIAGLFQACSPPLLFLPTIFWETSFSMCALMGLLAVAIWVRGGSTNRAWMFFGAFSGSVALLNPALLLSILGVAAGTALICRQAGRFRMAYAGLFAALFVLVFCAWPIRNARVFHAFIPLRTTMGMELWMGNHPGATGYLEESMFPTFNPGELQEYKRLGEVAYTNRKTDQARESIAAHPATFLTLTAKRFARFWLGTGNPHGSPLFAWQSILTTGFGFLGLAMLLRARQWQIAILLATPLFLFPIPYYITHAEFRFRVVIDPVLTVLGAYAFARWTERKGGGVGIDIPNSA